MTISKGDRVETTGAGRTASWPRTVGTVTWVTKRSVFVTWDHSIVEDELNHDEVRVIPDEVWCPETTKESDRGPIWLDLWVLSASPVPTSSTGRRPRAPRRSTWHSLGRGGVLVCPCGNGVTPRGHVSNRFVLTGR